MNQIRFSRKLSTAAACAHRAVVPRHRRAVCLPAAAAVLLAALGVAGVCPSAALASAPVLNWTEQHPATSPPAAQGGAMAYDAATRNVVLFGGASPSGLLGETWVWGPN
jgi:hypothetical protein